jgi:hypothetical protein
VAALPNDPGAQIPRSLRLNPSGGDVLVFEEVIGPQTGNPADADPTRRHAVRLTRAEPAVDPVTGWPVIEIEWAAEDALPFPFCLSSVGPAPECRYLDHVSVARGNVVLVDNGRSLPREPLGEAPVTPEDVTCECPGLASPSRWKAARFAPELAERPLTFRETPTRGLPASLALAQDPRRALPSVALTSYGFRRQASDDDASGSANVVWSGPLAWHARPDLLASGPGDAHFVVEMDDDRGAHLRFGDGRQGRAPSSDLKFVATGEPAPGPAPDSEVGTLFYASYRVGNGARGNVGAESISYLVTRGERVTGVSVNVRNPLPARGGTEPEPVSEAKLYAPHAFRRRIERAVTAGDYARIAEREFAAEVQRAAGRLRWTGSWYEALVAVDARGTPTPASSLLERVERRLYRYRRVLHDLAVLPAEQVPLDIELLVCVRPHHERGHVKQALLAAFSNRTLGDGRLGFFHPDELSFDDDVYASRIVALARSIPGVEHVELTRFQRLYEPPNGELAEGVLWLSPVEVARLDNDPNFPENGALRLVLRGGR